MLGKINDYTPIELLGHGSFGAVYLVQSVDKAQYAIKLIQVIKDNKNQAKKQAEMYLAFHHPNILKARQFFFYNQEKFLVIVLEYCPDGNLCNLIGKIDAEKSKNLVKETAQGLVYLHDEKKTIHCGIKPENILMKNDVPKIGDLGIAKFLNTSGVQTKIGTQTYLAPEVFYEEKYNNSADIWSLGILFLELLVGKRINNLVKGVLAPALRPDFPSKSLLNEIKQEECKKIVLGMLEKQLRIDRQQMRSLKD